MNDSEVPPWVFRCHECGVPLPQTNYWRTDLGEEHVPYCDACHDRVIAAGQTAGQQTAGPER